MLSHSTREAGAHPATSPALPLPAPRPGDTIKFVVCLYPAMAYQVLARKYRPQRFADVVGQDHVTVTLLNALAAGPHRPPHSGYIAPSATAASAKPHYRAHPRHGAQLPQYHRLRHPVPPLSPAGNLLKAAPPEIRAGNSVDTSSRSTQAPPPTAASTRSASLRDAARAPLPPATATRSTTSSMRRTRSPTRRLQCPAQDPRRAARPHHRR